MLVIHQQGYDGLKFYRTVTVAQEEQTVKSSLKLADLLQAIGDATTHQELQARVQKLFGRNTGLSPAELGRPMSKLRPILLARAEQVPNQLMQRIEAQVAIPDQLVKESLRFAISALAYAIGFAFLARVLPRRQAVGGGNRGVDEDYFQKLARVMSGLLLVHSKKLRHPIRSSKLSVASAIV